MSLTLLNPSNNNNNKKYEMCERCYLEEQMCHGDVNNVLRYGGRTVC
jgi:hypothetical protein